jgi:hypothetical protein
MILDRERIDASIDADVADKELRALDKVRNLINGLSPETTCGDCHRRAPSLPSQRHLSRVALPAGNNSPVFLVRGGYLGNLHRFRNNQLTRRSV